MPEHRRILFDEAAMQVLRAGDHLVAGDGRRVGVGDWEFRGIRPPARS